MLRLAAGPLLVAAAAAATAGAASGAARSLQSARPLTTCACDASDATQEWVLPAVGVPGPVASVADPTECWYATAENGVCDGLCLTLTPCSAPWATRFNLTLAPGGASYCFIHYDENGYRYCVQQNKEKLYMQLWGCTGECTDAGEDWAAVEGTGQLVDTWSDNALCMGECLAPTPTPSPSRRPSPSAAPPAAAAAAGGVDVGAAVGVPLGLLAVGGLALAYVPGAGALARRALADAAAAVERVGATAGGGSGGGASSPSRLASAQRLQALAPAAGERASLLAGKV